MKLITSKISNLAIVGLLSILTLATVDFSSFMNVNAANASKSSLSIYVVNPISHQKIIPDTPTRSLPLAGQADNRTIIIKACKGEFEPASFVLKSNVAISHISIVPTDFKGPGGNVISKEDLDIRLVKCWYKSDDNSIRHSKSRILTPELLLRDDRLVQVDSVHQKNYLRVTNNGHDEYMDISSPESAIPADAEFNDAAELQPFDLSAGNNKQVWLTVKIPEGIGAGDYNGSLQLIAAGKTIGQVNITVKVLPFDLSKPLMEYAMYYRGILSTPYVRGVGSELKRPSQYEREMRDMKDHGVDYPTLYQRFDNLRLADAFEIRQQIGFPADHLYTLGTTTANRTDGKSLAGLERRVNIWMQQAKKYGYNQVYIYGIDEARSERLLAQIPSWDVVHRSGAKMFVALYEGAVGVAGDAIDVAVLSGYKPAEVEKWHHRGKRVLCYGNPQVGIPDPSIYRRNYGLLLWVGGYDGCMPYAYQHAFGDIWNDFDHPEFRDHVFAYPTTDGLISTVQWEGFREAVGDIRYLSTLLQLEPQNESEIRSYIQSQISGKNTPPSEVREWIVSRILRHFSPGVQ
jgi:hypothetical protein